MSYKLRYMDEHIFFIAITSYLINKCINIRLYKNNIDITSKKYQCLKL